MLPYLYVYLLHYIHKPSFTHNITFVDLHVQVTCFCTVHVACLFHGIIISQKKKLIFQGIIPVSHTHNTSHIYMYIYIHANYRDCSEIDEIKVVAIVCGYHAYKDVLEVPVRRELRYKQEAGNPHALYQF